MKWIPLHLPKPEDGKHYDIRLKNGEIVRNVVFWDFGGGFAPLELDESVPASGHHVKYPVTDVEAFRILSCRMQLNLTVRV